MAWVRMQAVVALSGPAHLIHRWQSACTTSASKSSQASLSEPVTVILSEARCMHMAAPSLAWLRLMHIPHTLAHAARGKGQSPLGI